MLTPEQFNNSKDNLGAYLRDIGSISRLTAVQETSLAQKIEAGAALKRSKDSLVQKGLVNPSIEDIVADILIRNVWPNLPIKGAITLNQAEVDFPNLNLGFKCLPPVFRTAVQVLSPIQVMDQARRDSPLLREHFSMIAQEAAVAKQWLCIANLRLVVSVAKRYTKQGMELKDLIQEGNIGLMNAVERFDWRQGKRFSTFASWFIRGNIIDAVVNQARTIRIPHWTFYRVGGMMKMEAELTHSLGRVPNNSELASALNISEERLEEWRCAQALVPTPLESIFGRNVVPSNDQSILSPQEIVEEAEIKDLLKTSLNTLTNQERRIIELRFGLITDKGLTWEEITAELGISQNRSRLLEKRALRKLRKALDPISPQPRKADVEYTQLTPAELNVLHLAATGKNYSEIAETQGRKSTAAIKEHSRGILRKLNASTLVEAVTIAVRQDILDIEELAQAQNVDLTKLDLLSPAQRNILPFLVAYIEKNKIANLCSVTSEAIKAHLIAIYSRLGVKGRMQTVIFAMQAQAKGKIPIIKEEITAQK